MRAASFLLTTAATLLMSAPPAGAGGGETAIPFLTTVTPVGIDALREQKPIPWIDKVEYLPTFVIAPWIQYQELEGYGGAMTESCAMNLLRLPMSSRLEVMRRLFSKTDGAGFDVIRVPVGASDFADGTKGSYSYDDPPGQAPDPRLKYFDMSRDEKSFQLIRLAQKINPDAKVIISPWSPPPWMKTNRHFNGGRLQPAHYQDYANYLALVSRELLLRGIHLDGLTIQNEPEYETTYPSMYMTSNEQAAFIRRNLGPTLRLWNLPVRILAMDQNYYLAPLATPLFDDPQTKQYLGGVAYHCYGGEPWMMLDHILTHPDLPTLVTECTAVLGGKPEGDFHWWLSNQAIEPVNLGATGALGWNLCLDEEGGPKNGGCQDCRGYATIDHSSPNSLISYAPEYHALAQVSRFMRKGARRIYMSTPHASLMHSLAFRNPNGSVVLVFGNPTEKAIRFQVKIADGKALTYTLGAKNAVTFEWRDSTTP